jgi:hypothetical protein
MANRNRCRLSGFFLQLTRLTVNNVTAPSGLANAHPKLQSENKKLAIRSISVKMSPSPPTLI